MLYCYIIQVSVRLKFYLPYVQTIPGDDFKSLFSTKYRSDSMLFRGVFVD